MLFRDLWQLLRVERHQWNAARFGLLLGLVLSPPASAQSLSAVGSLGDGELSELSGLAASRRVAGRWWGLNDSGNAAALFALDGQGRPIGRLLLKASNIDWEDLASFEDQGQAYLAIADTGDNFSLRKEVSILVLREPGAEVPASALLERQIRFVFADGPRDCEALAADPAHQRFLLIDKGRHPAGLYELPMRPGSGLALARRIADLPDLWPESLPPVSPVGASRARGSATAMDLSADGRRLLALTYRHLVLFERGPDEDWPQVFARPPRMLPFKLKLAEALAWDAAGISALIGAEGEHAPLLRWDGRMPAR